MSPFCLVTRCPHLGSSAHTFPPTWNILFSAHSQSAYSLRAYYVSNVTIPQILLPWGRPDNFGPCSCLSLLISDTGFCLHYTSGHLITFWAPAMVYVLLSSWHTFSGDYVVDLVDPPNPAVLGTWEKVNESPLNSTEFILSLEESGGFWWDAASQPMSQGTSPWQPEILYIIICSTPQCMSLVLFFLPCLVGLVTNGLSFQMHFVFMKGFSW